MTKFKIIGKKIFFKLIILNYHIDNEEKFLDK